MGPLLHERNWQLAYTVHQAAQHGMRKVALVVSAGSVRMGGMESMDMEDVHGAWHGCAVQPELCALGLLWRMHHHTKHVHKLMPWLWHMLCRLAKATCQVSSTACCTLIVCAKQTVRTGRSLHPTWLPCQSNSPHFEPRISNNNQCRPIWCVFDYSSAGTVTLIIYVAWLAKAQISFRACSS